MNILDENIPKPQRQLLEARRQAVKQIGVNIGCKGMLDEAITPLLLGVPHPTFFSRDSDFYKRDLCHSNYCIVHLSVEKSETALFIRRLLSHPAFKTRADRMGKDIRVSRAGISFWHRHQSKEDHVEWK